MFSNNFLVIKHRFILTSCMRSPRSEAGKVIYSGGKPSSDSCFSPKARLGKLLTVLLLP